MDQSSTNANNNYDCDYSYQDASLSDNYMSLSNINLDANANNNNNYEYSSRINAQINSNLACRVKKMKGVRKRSWGRWVSEIRVPRSRERVWLGSYATAEQASRAYEAARHYLHTIATYNSHSGHPQQHHLSKEAIQSIAAAAAAANEPGATSDADKTSHSLGIRSEPAGEVPSPADSTPTLAYPIPPLSPSPAAISSMISFFQQRALRRRSPVAGGSAAGATSSSSALTWPLSPSISSSSSEDDWLHYCPRWYN